MNKTIFGIDIARGSPKAKEPARYGIAILREDGVEHHSLVSKQKLLRMINQEKPGILAVDNIHELTRDRRDLVSFLRKLPPKTKFVQVTGAEHPDALPRIAQKYGISFDRLDPNQEAEVCAILASKGIGYEISAFEDRTRIKVSRARSLGKGGWSQNRYRRKVHGSVRHKTREIEDALEEHAKKYGIGYTSKVTEGFGGYIRGEFIVDAAKTSLGISSEKHSDVQVTVNEIERDALKFIPLKKREYTIVGIDPGTTTGLAILSLEGELLLLHSSRTITPSEIVELISEQGRPLIIATDVTPAPNSVEKIRRAFNAVLGAPEEDLSAEGKVMLSKPFEYANNHERDALAAAISIHRKYKNKFDQIKKKIPYGIQTDEVIARVVRGETVESSIGEMTRVEMERPEKIEELKPESRGEAPELREIVRKQEEQITSLKKYLDELKAIIKSREETIQQQERQIAKLKTEAYREIKGDKEIQIREKELNRLKKELQEKDFRLEKLRDQVERLKQIRRLEASGRGLPVKIIEAFARDSILKTSELYGIRKGDIVLLEDASGGGPSTVELLASKGVKAVIALSEMSHIAEEEFFKANIPVFNGKEIPVERVEDYAVLDPDILKKAMDVWDKKAEEKRKRSREEWLQSLVEEYRNQRRREQRATDNP